MTTISKVKKMDESTKREIELSEKIKNFQYRFQPILSLKEIIATNTQATNTQATNTQATNTQATNTQTKHKTNMVSCQYRNVQGKTIDEYIRDNAEHPRIFELVASLEEYLEKTLELLPCLINIDESTIIIDEINHVPILTITDYKEPHTRPIEFYFFQNKDSTVMTYEQGEEIFYHFFKNSPLFNNEIITDTELIEMKERYNKYIVSILGKSFFQIKKEWTGNLEKKWNKYQLSVVFLEILSDITHINMDKQKMIEKHKQRIMDIPKIE